MICYTAPYHQHSSQFCVYVLSIADPTNDGKQLLMFAAAATFTEAFALDAAKRNSEWDRMVKPEMVITMTIQPYPNAGTAHDACRAYIAAHQPHCNVVGFEMKLKSARRRGKVICTTDNDREFENASQAAAYYNVAASNMSSHLRGMKYFETVGGHKFKRLEA